MMELNLPKSKKQEILKYVKEIISKTPNYGLIKNNDSESLSFRFDNDFLKREEVTFKLTEIRGKLHLIVSRKINNFGTFYTPEGQMELEQFVKESVKELEKEFGNKKGKDKKLICHKCKTKLIKKSKYCPECGAKQ